MFTKVVHETHQSSLAMIIWVQVHSINGVIWSCVQFFPVLQVMNFLERATQQAAAPRAASPPWRPSPPVAPRAPSPPKADED